MPFVPFYSNFVGMLTPPTGSAWSNLTIANLKGPGGGDATSIQLFSPTWTQQAQGRAPWLRQSDDKPLVNVISPEAVLNAVRILFRIKKSNLSGAGDILPNFDESGTVEHWSFQAFDFTEDGWEDTVSGTDLPGTTFKNNETVTIADGVFSDMVFGTDIGVVHNASYLDDLSLIRGDLALACALYINAGSIGGTTATVHIDAINLLVDFTNPLSPPLRERNARVLRSR